MMTQSLFLVGTDTDVGKTYVAGLLMKKFREMGYNLGYYKAVLSGGYYAGEQLIPGDAEYVLEQGQLDEEYESCVSYTLENSISPHLAARWEGVHIDLEKIKNDYQYIASKYEHVIVEGSGGIVCPIVLEEDRHILLEDIIKALEIPVVVIARAGLGTINHTVLTLEYLKNRGFDIKGIIINGYEPCNKMHEDNVRVIERLTGVKVILKVIQDATIEEIDWSKLEKNLY